MNEPHLWLNTIFTFLSLLIAAAALRYAMKSDNRVDVLKQAREMAVMGERVSVMWASFMASGVTKGIAHGALSMDSPVRLTDGSAEMLDTLRVALQAFRNDECPDCKEQELSMKIAARFKEEIIKLCAPNHIQFEVGLVIATAIAKGTRTLTEILDAYVPTPPTPE